MPDPLVEIEQLGAKESGPCSCCGSETRRVWGFVHRGPTTEAAYFVSWTPGAVLQHGAAVDLVLGAWGKGTIPSDRVAISAVFKVTDRGPEFMVVDATGRPHVRPDVVTRALTRAEVIGTPVATRAFAVLDEIWLGDPRIAELFSASRRDEV
jgi:hypothetical protein